MDTEAAELLTTMLAKRFFVMLRTPRAIDRVDTLLTEHLRWMVAAEGRGQIFASGPFVAKDRKPGELGGLTIIRASSRDEAEAIALQDPFIAEGVFDYELREWMLMEGRISFSLSLSKCSVNVY